MDTTLTIRQLHDAYQALERLGQREGLKAGPSFWTASLLKRWKPDYEMFLEKRQGLFEKYGTKSADDSGRELWRVSPENEAQFNEEYRPLLDESVVVTYSPHALKFLGEKAAAIEPSLLYRLSFLFEHTEPDLAQTEVLTRRQAEEVFGAISAMATYKMPEDLGWRVAAIYRQAEAIAERTQEQRMAALWQCPLEKGVRQTTPEYRAWNEALGKEKVEIQYAPMTMDEFGDDLVEQMTPVMFAPLLFAISEPSA